MGLDAAPGQGCLGVAWQGHCRCAAAALPPTAGSVAAFDCGRGSSAADRWTRRSRLRGLGWSSEGDAEELQHREPPPRGAWRSHLLTGAPLRLRLPLPPLCQRAPTRLESPPAQPTAGPFFLARLNEQLCLAMAPIPTYLSPAAVLVLVSCDLCLVRASKWRAKAGRDVPGAGLDRRPRDWLPRGSSPTPARVQS